MLWEIFFIICYFCIIFICLYVDLHKELIKKYREKYGINKEKCYLIIRDIDECMRKHKIFYYMSEGTALGLYRDGDLITWDDDVDIGIFEEDYDKFIKFVVPEMVKLGYVHGRLISNRVDFFIGRQHFLDVEVVRKNGKCISKYMKPCAEMIPYLRSFRKKKWRNLELNLPEDGYYEYLYGPDWRIPKKKKPEK